MRNFILALQFSAVLISGNAMAQGYKPLVAVQDLPGWQCMALASAYGPNGINAPAVPVFAGPQSTSPKVGTGAGVIIVPSPLTQQNGRTEMIWPNGKKVWIDVSELTQWHSLSNPHATCRPALMSNGRYGYATTN
jgi:hypothetical protein